MSNLVRVILILVILPVGCDDGDDSGSDGDDVGGSGGENLTCTADGICRSSCADDPDCEDNATSGGSAASGGAGGQVGESGTGSAGSCDPQCDSDEFCNQASGVCVSLEPEWITLEGGTFQMGSEEDIDEQPVHSVTVPGFEILKTEVTVSQFSQCVTAKSCIAPLDSSEMEDNWGKSERENHPMNGVNWSSADSYCRWIGGRLPTEAEWEYAARSRGKDIRYPWGNESATCDYAVMFAGSKGCGTGTSAEVCSKIRGNTEQGICDMAGNVCEWVEDDWAPGYDETPTDGSAWIETPRSEQRTLRNGYFSSGSGLLRSTHRTYAGLNNPAESNGFRCAR